MKLIFSALPVFLFSALAAPAQDAASGVAESAGPTLIELFHQGGWLMWVLLAFSVFAIANKPIGARLDINIVFKGNK